MKIKIKLNKKIYQVELNKLNENINQINILV